MGNNKTTAGQENLKAAKRQAEQNAQKKEKMQTVLITVCVVLVAALVIGLAVYNRMVETGALLRGQVAAESENFEVTGTMMAYFYNMNYQSYYPYLSYLGADTTKSLKAQTSLYGTGTWFDYFVDMTKSYVSEVLALCEGAKAEGMKLESEDYDAIDAGIVELEATAKASGMNVNQYLAASTGNPITTKDVKKCSELVALATKYSAHYTSSLTYTDEQKQAYYEEHKADFDGVDYLSFTVNAADFTEKAEDGTATSDAATDSANAKAAAEKLAAAKSADEFKTLVRDYINEHGDEKAIEAIEDTVANLDSRHVIAANMSVSEWAFAAAAGDTKVEGDDGATSFNVYYLTKPSYRDEVTNRNVRHILFAAETNEDATKVESVYAEWEAAGFTEDKLAELAEQYSEDPGSNTNGGLYESVAIGETTTEFNDWLFADERKPGDHGIVETAIGWHILYYVGEGEGQAWQNYVYNAMNAADYNALIVEKSAGIVYNSEAINGINA